MFNSRKGITPLVATILLVAFSVGLGALVMSWGEEYVRENAEFAQGAAEVKSECLAASISLINIAGQSQACISDKGLELWIDNGPKEVYQIQARIAGRTGVDVIDNILQEPLLAINAVKALVHYNQEIGDILQVKLTPMILKQEGFALCPEAAINIEQIGAC
ncbi:hypothetical protein COV18_07580 [Candidatus Woesearchaeota archaeon CG10_big_fil_rev_8_21_14_0_10_37_12]|nr:MAG: hypothetical protein COV18_07580 [Candidatus Woesearchaeota archaeon CG10_big_fil_rev_8_21_14_0_10_37_12]